MPEPGVRCSNHRKGVCRTSNWMSRSKVNSISVGYAHFWPRRLRRRKKLNRNGPESLRWLPTTSHGKRTSFEMIEKYGLSMFHLKCPRLNLKENKRMEFSFNCMNSILLFSLPLMQSKKRHQRLLLYIVKFLRSFGQLCLSTPKRVILHG